MDLFTTKKKKFTKVFKKLLKQLLRDLRGLCRSHLKNVFWPNIFVGASLQILDIQQYASGMKLGPAAILNQNPIFETASIKIGLYK